MDPVADVEEIAAISVRAVVRAAQVEVFAHDPWEARFRERPDAERVPVEAGRLRIANHLVGRERIVGPHQRHQRPRRDGDDLVERVADGAPGHEPAHEHAVARNDGLPREVAHFPEGPLHRRSLAVPAKLDRDTVLERQQVVHHRLAARFERRQLLLDLRDAEHLVIHGHRPDRLDPERDLEHHAEQAEARPHGLQQLGLCLGDHRDVTVGQHRLDPDRVRRDDAEFTRKRRVLGQRARGAAHRQVAELDVDVELATLLFERFRDVDVERAGLGGHGVVADLDDAVHAAHVHDRARIRDDTARRRVTRAGGAHR